MRDDIEREGDFEDPSEPDGGVVRTPDGHYYEMGVAHNCNHQDCPANAPGGPTDRDSSYNQVVDLEPEVMVKGPQRGGDMAPAYVVCVGSALCILAQIAYRYGAPFSHSLAIGVVGLLVGGYGMQWGLRKKPREPTFD